MAWTAPRTWVTTETVTAAHMNAHVRDNLLETAAATATTAGDIVYADAANSMGSRVGIGTASGLLISTGSAPIWRVPQTDTDSGTATFTNTSYLTLANVTGGSALAGEVSVVVTCGTSALVLVSSRLSNDTATATTSLSYSVSGTTTQASSDLRRLFFTSESANTAHSSSWGHIATGLNAGSNTFTLTAKVSSGTGSVVSPYIAVFPL